MKQPKQIADLNFFSPNVKCQIKRNILFYNPSSFGYIINEITFPKISVQTVPSIPNIKY